MEIEADAKTKHWIVAAVVFHHQQQMNITNFNTYVHLQNIIRCFKPIPITK
jgi:hypothetical protein